MSITKLRSLISTCAWLVSPDLKTNIIKKIWNPSQYFFSCIISLNEKIKPEERWDKHLICFWKMSYYSPQNLDTFCFKYLKIFQKIIIQTSAKWNAFINRRQLIVSRFILTSKKKKAEVHQHISRNVLSLTVS